MCPLLTADSSQGLSRSYWKLQSLAQGWRGALEITIKWGSAWEWQQTGEMVWTDSIVVLPCSEQASCSSSLPDAESGGFFRCAPVSPSGKSTLVSLRETILPTPSIHKVWVEPTSPSVPLAESWAGPGQWGCHTCSLMAGIPTDGWVLCPNQMQISLHCFESKLPLPPP